VEYEAADLADQADDVSAITPAACTTWSRAALSAMVKLARSGL
jgi:hypothetical protein